jgi:hypothetical protein
MIRKWIEMIEEQLVLKQGSPSKGQDMELSGTSSDSDRALPWAFHMAWPGWVEVARLASLPQVEKMENHWLQQVGDVPPSR